jgi:hypothetical protein
MTREKLNSADPGNSAAKMTGDLAFGGGPAVEKTFVSLRMNEFRRIGFLSLRLYHVW